MRLMIKSKNNYTLASTEEIIEEFRNGRMVILVDDEERENEGDLIIPAQMATPDSINFMARYGRGLICLALTQERCQTLGLELMPKRNESRHDTAFTLSIEAREGITTGISAVDRAVTVGVAIDPAKGLSDITSPGHVFPLMARDGGCLVRAGHTEAGVDLARLAGLNPAAVICEIMSEDGTMARMPDLINFAKNHEIKIGTIESLIAYRLRYDTIVQHVHQSTFNSLHGGEFQMHLYVNTVEYAEHIALVKGDISGEEPVLVRVHDFNPLEDVLMSVDANQGGRLQSAMDVVGKTGRGIIILIREPRQTRVTDLLNTKNNKTGSIGLRDYGIGAQILLDLGVKNMTLLHNTHWTIVGLDGYGLTVTGHQDLPVFGPNFAEESLNLSLGASDG